jgi:hypothetical protein
MELLSEVGLRSGKDPKHEAPTSEQHEGPGFKPESRNAGLLQQASDEYYDAEADEDDVRTEVTTLDGKTHKNTLPYTSTVLVLKQHLAREAMQAPSPSKPTCCLRGQ